MFLQKETILNFLKQNWHAVIFTILGLLITALPLASSRLYMCYVMGLVLVWTIPPITCVVRKYLSGFMAICLLVAKGYYIYLQPKLEVQVFPIATYNQQLVVSNSGVSESLLNNLVTRFKKYIEISEKLPGVKPDKFSNFNNSKQSINTDFMYSYKHIDLIDSWGVPSNISSLISIPVVLSIHVINGGKAHFFAQTNFYVNNINGSIDSLSGDGKTSHELSKFEGKTLFFPFIDAQDSHWLYLSVWEYGVYIPFLLLIFACVICAWEKLKTNAVKFIEHTTAMGISIFVALLETLNPLYLGTSSIAVKNYQFYSGLHDGFASHNFVEAPLWFLLHKALKGIIDLSILLPLVCIYLAAFVFLQLLKKLFEEKMAYVVWAVLLVTPWFMFYNFGLHTFRFLWITHNPLILGTPLFLFGLIGYLEKFKHQHGVAFLLAALCHPMLGSIICVLLLHKHLPKQRYVYLALCAGLYLFFAKDRLLSADNILENPILAWFLMTLKAGHQKLYATNAINYLSQAYSILVVLFAVIPNAILGLKESNTTWRLFSRCVIAMHIMWFFDGNSSEDLFLANTLSVLVALRFYQPFYQRYSVKYAKLAAACK